MVAARDKIPGKGTWAEQGGPMLSKVHSAFPRPSLVVSGTTAAVYREDKRISHLPKVTWVVSSKKSVQAFGFRGPAPTSLLSNSHLLHTFSFPLISFESETYCIS